MSSPYTNEFMFLWPMTYDLWRSEVPPESLYSSSLQKKKTHIQDPFDIFSGQEVWVSRGKEEGIFLSIFSTELQIKDNTSYSHPQGWFGGLPSCFLLFADKRMKLVSWVGRERSAQCNFTHLKARPVAHPYPQSWIKMIDLRYPRLCLHLPLFDIYLTSFERSKRGAGFFGLTLGKIVDRFLCSIRCGYPWLYLIFGKIYFI